MDVDSNYHLASEYHITAIPKLMIFRDGKNVYEHTGTCSEIELRNELKKHTKTNAGKPMNR